jgi:pimeloyl-ACP methyl ester carboxylesterase
MNELHSALVSSRNTVSVRGGTLAYIEQGTGEPVLFVHGVFLSGLLFAPAMELLPPDYRYIAFDLPAHGHSAAFTGTQLTVRSCAEILVEAIDCLGLTDVHLVGNDSGGAICQVMVAIAPQRFASLILTNCDTLGNMPPAGFAPVVELAAAGGLLPVLAQMHSSPDLVRGEAGFGANLQDPTTLTDEYIAAFLDPVMQSSSKQLQMQNLVGSFTANDLAGHIDHALHDVDVPTLVAWGDSDPLFEPHWGTQLAAKLGALATHVTIPNGRFLYPFERPTEFAELAHKHWNASHHHPTHRHPMRPPDGELCDAAPGHDESQENS